jgi:hypothetical protein
LKIILTLTIPIWKSTTNIARLPERGNGGHRSRGGISVHGLEADVELLIPTWEQVAVAIKGDLDGGVPQPGLHDFGVGANRWVDEQGSAGVPEVVETEAEQVGRKRIGHRRLEVPAVEICVP